MRRTLAVLAVLAAALVVSPAGEAAGSAHRDLTPVVLFPAFHFTKLEVTVRHQTAFPGCPRSGAFQDWFLNPHQGTTFSQVCRDELLTLRYDRHSHKPMRLRFSNQRGVSVRILHYGKTESAPFYDPLYTALEAAGYTRDKNIRVAGYDSRLTPDMNHQLDTSDAPFGKVVQPLHFRRQTLSAELLWSPLPEGWDGGATLPASSDKPLTIPDHVLQHRAVLYTGSNQPFSLVVESYTSHVLRRP